MYPPAWVGTEHSFVPQGTAAEKPFLGCGGPAQNGTKSAYAGRFPPTSLYATFALIDRGDCAFIEKVFNAQMQGASAVVIVDNIYEGLVTSVAPDLDADDRVYELISKVNIPSVMVTKTQGGQLKDLARAEADGSGEQLIVTLDWTASLNVTAGKISVEYWTTSNQLHVSDRLEAEFEAQARDEFVRWQKEGQLDFTPHYLLSPCCAGAESIFHTDYGIPACTPEFMDPGIHPGCSNGCINGGRYCLNDPDGDLDAGNTGSDVMLQNLREIAVREYGRQEDKPEAWWDFAYQFGQRCKMSENKFTQACAESVLKSLGIDVNRIEELMGPHGRDAGTNDLLDAELLASTANSSCHPEDPGCQGAILYTPTILINEDQYRGTLAAAGVLDAMCGTYQTGTGPANCQGGYVNNTGVTINTSSSDGVSIWSVLVIVIVCVAVASVVIVFFYRRHVSNHMSSEIRSIMANYMPLDDSNGGPGPRGFGSSTVVHAIDEEVEMK